MLYVQSYILIHDIIQITKYQVENFNSGQRIPECELTLRWMKEDEPPGYLEHEVMLRGADHKYFTLSIPNTGTVDVLFMRHSNDASKLNFCGS